jgi:hypothetical protein
MPTRKFTRDILLAALAGFQLDKQRIDTQIAEVEAMLGSGGPTQEAASEEAPRKRTRKNFSAAARRKMALAQKARWAKIKGESEPEPSTPEPTKTKRTLSAAGRKSLQESMRRRWAVKKTEAKAAATKKTATKKAAAKRPPAKTAVKRSVLKKTAQGATPAIVGGAGQ